MARKGLKKTSAKGHKWKKGHSCLSNPEATKHRQAARGQFFQRLDGPSNLTQAALSEHNKIAWKQTKEDRMNSEGEEEEEEEEEEGEGEELTEIEKQMKELGVEEDDLRSAGGKTFNTFATSFSTCTLPAFEKFFHTFNQSSDQHARMLAIHAAAQEYLRDTNTPETPTSYYCSLMISLEGVRDSEEDTAAALSLMTVVARRVSKEVLAAKFSDFAGTLMATVKRYAASDNSKLLANAIGSLSILLRGQEKAEWENASTLNIFNTIMGFCVHPKPKIRRAGQYNTAAILSTDSTARHPAAAAAAEFCLVNLRLSTESRNSKTTLHTLVLLRQIIAFLPKKQIKAVCECLLSVMQIGQPLINRSVLQVIHALFAAHPPPEVLPVNTNTALIHALTQGALGGSVGAGVVVVPGKNDSDPACAWITVVTMAILNLFRLSEEAGMTELQRWATLLLPYWQSDHPSVHLKVRESLATLVQDGAGVCGAEVLGGAGCAAVLEALSRAVSLQCQAAWGQVFLCLAAAFPVLGRHQPGPARTCLAALCQLAANSRVPHRAALHSAVGAAVAALGPGPLLELVPLTASGDVSRDEAGWWTLPLLSRHVRDTELGEFVERLVPVAGQCFRLLASLQREGRRESVEGRAYQQVERQVWAALPAFCRGARDADEALRREGFARLLCDHLKHRPDTRQAVMEALRVLLAEGHAPRLTDYAKNYLPALFNIYLTPPGTDGTTKGQRQAALATVEAFLAVVPPGRAAELLALVLQRHSDAQRGGDRSEAAKLRRRALLSLAAALVPRLEGQSLATLCDHVAPLLGAKDHGQQKAAYRLLEQVLSAETPATAALVEQRLDVLRETLLTHLSSAAASAQAPRLRCLRLLLLRLGPETDEAVRQAVLQKVVGEAVVSCGRAVAQAGRRAAFLLLSEVGAVLQQWEDLSPRDTVLRVLELLLAGLAGSVSLASATMLALTALTYQHSQQVDKQILDVLVQNTCVQMLCPARELVASCCSFIKTMVVLFPAPVLAPHLPPIMQALANMTPDCQRKHRLRTRDILDRLIRKFGIDAITALVPPGDTIFHKRLRNLRKMADRKKREREERRRALGEEEEEEEEEENVRPLPASLDEILEQMDSDADDDDEKGKKKMKKKKRKGSTWIKEDDEEVLDLLDAGAGQAIVSGAAAAAAGVRGAARSKAAFKVDKDSGKMIITDDDDGGGGGGGGGGGEKMDFTDDLDEILGLKAAAAGGKVKKRKRADSVGSAEVMEGGGGGGGGKGPMSEGRKKAKKDPGAEFRSRKAGGDVTLKGKDVAPFAYVRLAKEQLNRRKKAKFDGQFGSLVRGAKKGVRGARKGGKGRGKGRK